MYINELPAWDSGNNVDPELADICDKFQTKEDAVFQLCEELYNSREGGRRDSVKDAMVFLCHSMGMENELDMIREGEPECPLIDPTT